jgi:hypothetical protein
LLSYGEVNTVLLIGLDLGNEREYNRNGRLDCDFRFIFAASMRTCFGWGESAKALQKHKLPTLRASHIQEPPAATGGAEDYECSPKKARRNRDLCRGLGLLFSVHDIDCDRAPARHEHGDAASFLSGDNADMGVLLGHPDTLDAKALKKALKA